MGPRSNKKGNPKKYRPRIMPRDLRRAIPDRTESKSILIVCEDSKASPGYFKKLRSELGLCSVNVEIYGEECDSAPIGVVDFAKKRKLDVRTSTIQDGYDEIFCVVDHADIESFELRLDALFLHAGSKLLNNLRAVHTGLPVEVDAAQGQARHIRPAGPFKFQTF